DPSTLLDTFQATPEYLRTAYDADVVNFRDWGIQLGRRFRALKLWFVVRSYGVDGLRSVIRRHVALAAELAGWVKEDPEFELMAPVPFGLVCFRWAPAGRTHEEIDALNARLLALVNAGRERYLTHTRLGGRYVIRLVVGQRGTEREHVAAAWNGVKAAAQKLRDGSA
ncbi:MAG TPA: pyridoxal-dependent decarboxylase, partial [Gemmatimonadales bacterium]|nr:pyridoxal-dependent decarboxylase [Gemmatimonadales bacterium]